MIDIMDVVLLPFSNKITLVSIEVGILYNLASLAELVNSTCNILNSLVLLLIQFLGFWCSLASFCFQFFFQLLQLIIMGKRMLRPAMGPSTTLTGYQWEMFK